MTTTDDKTKRYNVPGLERGLAILSAFTRDTPELGAPELISMLDLPRSTVFRLLQTLESHGYLVRTRDGRTYRLGSAVLRMGFEYLASQSVVEVGRPLVERLSRNTGLPAHLVIRDGRSVVYAVCAKPRSALVGTVTVGTRLPAHATVFGRILLGEHDQAELHALFVDDIFEHKTGQTPTTVDRLHQLIQADATRGFGISEGFYEPRISTIAAPVRDHDSQIVAAVGVTITSPRIDPALIADGVVEETVETAAEIATGLGCNDALYMPARANATALRSQQKEVNE